MKPLIRSLPIMATAFQREIVAMLPLSKYLNGSWGALPLTRRLDLLGGELGALDGHLGNAREVVQRDHVADHEHLGMARQGQVGVDADPAGPVQRGTGLLGECRGQWAGLHSGRPDLGDRVDAALVAVLVLDHEAQLVHVGHHGAELYLDAEVVEGLLGLLAQLRAERRQHL